MTLIEVVAGIFLLSVLMVSLLAAMTQHKQQAAVASEKLAALDMIDRQIELWTVNETNIPFPASGRFSSSDFTWRTSQAALEAHSLPPGLVTVNIEVLDPALHLVTSLQVLTPRPVVRPNSPPPGE